MKPFEVEVEGRIYDVDAPDERTAWKWANKVHKQKQQERTNAIELDKADRREAFKQDEAARPLGQRILTNIGAGMDSAWQGAKQLVGAGPSDEEIEDKRRRDDVLGDATGLGALQTVGEIAPTLAIPGGGFVKAAGAIPKAGGMLTKALAGRRGLTAATDAALAGAATGGLALEKSDESALANVALGAAGGAGVVGGVNAAMKGGRVLKRAFSPTAAREGQLERGGEAIRRQLAEAGEDADAVAARLSAPRTSPITGNVPLSAAQAVDSPTMARIELAARRDAPEGFMNLERRQNEALFDSLESAAVDAPHRQLYAEARDMTTGPLREEALKKAGRFKYLSEPLLKNYVPQIEKASVPGSPQRALAKLARQFLEENPSPEQLYQFRKLLASKLSGPFTPGDEVAAIVKGADRETKALMSQIDNRLNVGSDGKWQEYLGEYVDRSKPVTSARAQERIMDDFNREGVPFVGNRPQVTRARLGRALDKYGKNSFGDTLTDSARSRFDDLQGFLREIEERSRTLKIAGTGGGGSQTAMQQGMNVLKKTGTMLLGSKVPAAAVAGDVVSEIMARRTRATVAELMQDPGEAAKAIRLALKQRQPLTQAELQFLRIMRSGGAAAGSSGQSPMPQPTGPAAPMAALPR